MLKRIVYFFFEDCAQAIGASINNKKVGNFGNLGFFSLHPLKNVHVLGDGGFITVKYKRDYEKLKLLRNNGHKNRDEIISWGYNSRLDEIQAAFGIALLKKYKSNFEKFNGLQKCIEKNNKISYTST